MTDSCGTCPTCRLVALYERVADMEEDVRIAPRMRAVFTGIAGDIESILDQICGAQPEDLEDMKVEGRA